jgi:hypothetical protein
MTLNSKDQTKGSQSMRVTAGQANQSIIFQSKYSNDTYVVDNKENSADLQALTSWNVQFIQSHKE